MQVTFMCPSTPHPVGGVLAVFGFANGLRRRGHDVHLVHLPMWDEVVTDVDQLAWCRFEPGIHHYFPGGTDRRIVPDADIVFGVGALANLGLPVSLIQGLMTFQPELERAVFRAPCLKVCISGWLVEVGRSLGVPPQQLVHVPMGIDHEAFTCRTPYRERPRQVAVLHGRHPAKGWTLGLEALELVHAARPDVEIVAFGTAPPEQAAPEWLRFVLAPDRPQLSSLLDRSRVLLQPSSYEGFGFAAVEAMACGAALVTSDNGGSRDYAVDGLTAVVASRTPRDLAEATIELLDDPDRAAALAAAGRRHVARFDWDLGAAVLEEALLAYLADPDRFRGPPGDAAAVDWTADALLALTAATMADAPPWPPEGSGPWSRDPDEDAAVHSGDRPTNGDPG